MWGGMVRTLLGRYPGGEYDDEAPPPKPSSEEGACTRGSGKTPVPRHPIPPPLLPCSVAWGVLGVGKGGGDWDGSMATLGNSP